MTGPLQDGTVERPRTPVSLQTRSAPVLLELIFDTRVIPQAAVLQALYRCSDRAAVTVTLNDHDLLCRLEILDPLTDSEALRATVLRDALDETLRAQVRAQTAGIRDVIFAHAFSALSVVEPVVGHQVSEPKVVDG